MLERNPRGLLVTPDELTAWVRGHGQYKGGRGTDRQFWLSAWSGEPFVYDRKGKPPVVLPKPFASVLAGIQPQMISELMDRSGRADGLLDRLLFAFPEPPECGCWTDTTVSSASTKAWQDAIDFLTALPLEIDHAGVPKSLIVDLNAKAAKGWRAWFDAHNKEVNSPDFDSRLEGVWAKMRSHCARLCLVVHLLRFHSGETKSRTRVDEKSLDAAVQLATYFKCHLRKAWAELGQRPVDIRAMLIVKWARARKRFTARDMQQANVGGIRKASEARERMRTLEDLGHGRIEKRVADNGKTVEEFVFGVMP